MKINLSHMLICDKFVLSIVNKLYENDSGSDCTVHK